MRNFFVLFQQAASRTPDAEALVAGDARLTYRALAALGLAFAARLQALEIAQGERLAIFLDKRIETVVAMLGAAAAGVVFVPINPVLKPEQVHHILVDSGARCLDTSSLRARILGDGVLAGMPYVILTDAKTLAPAPASRTTFLRWMQPDAPPESVANRHASAAPEPRADTIDADLAALLYTSGSTGRPKGVMLSHRNLLEGAWSVAQYLRHTAQDRILAALPLSFDAGLSQLTTAWAAGASAVLVNYLRSRLGQQTGGHISPLGAYDAAADRFLILDVSRYKYPPVWVTTADLYAAMNTPDADSGGRSRGYVLIDGVVAGADS